MEVESLREEQHRSHPDVSRQNDDESFGLVKNGTLGLKLSPSLLARKILCAAYVPAPFSEENRLRFLGLHAMAALRVIGRHLRSGYRLKAIEKQGNGYRIDLIFEKPSGGTRLNEVKSAKCLTELHRLQAALYSNSNYDEIVVSNGDSDIVLTEAYVREVQHRAHLTRELLTKQPEVAASTFRPNESVCRVCANSCCPYLPCRRTEGTVIGQPHEGEKQ